MDHRVVRFRSGRDASWLAAAISEEVAIRERPPRSSTGVDKSVVAIDRVGSADQFRPSRGPLKPMPSIAVIMPAYDEAARIERTITTIARYWSSGARVEHVVVADDGSTDGTADVAMRTAEREGLALEVLRFPHRGKALTVRSAMLAVVGRVKTDYVMMLDADDELRIDQLDRVAWSYDPRTIYIGRRVGGIDGQAGARPTPLRRAMSMAMRIASRVLLGMRFPDTQCGFKLFPTAIAGDLFAQQRSTGWTFDAEILFLADRVSRLPIREIPVLWRPRGASHVRASSAVLSAVGMLGVFGRRVLGRYRPVGVVRQVRQRGRVSVPASALGDSTAWVTTKTRS